MSAHFIHQGHLKVGLWPDSCVPFGYTVNATSYPHQTMTNATAWLILMTITKEDEKYS